MSRRYLMSGFVALALFVGLAWWWPSDAPSPSTTASVPQRAPAARRLTPSRSVSPLVALMREPDLHRRMQLLNALLAGLTTSEEFAEVAAYLASLPLSIDLDFELTALSQAWARVDGRAALEFLGTIQPRNNGLHQPANAAMREWTRLHPDEAARYAATLSLNQSAWRATVLTATAYGLAEHDPAAALAWALQDDPQRHRAIAATTSALVAGDPAGIAGWLARHASNPLDVRDAVLETTGIFTRRDPHAALLWILSDLPAGEVQQQALAAAIRPAAAQDPAALAALLQDPLFRDVLMTVPAAQRATYYQNLLTGFVDGASYSKQPEWALASLGTLVDPDTQQRLRNNYYAALNASGQVNPWTSSTATPPPAATTLQLLDLGDAPPAESGEALLARPPAPTLLIAASPGDSFAAPSAPPRQDSEGNWHYLIYSDQSVPLTIQVPDRSATSAIVTTYDRDSVVTTVENGAVRLAAEPGKRTVIDFGGGRRTTVIVSPPEPHG